MRWLGRLMLMLIRNRMRTMRLRLPALVVACLAVVLR